MVNASNLVQQLEWLRILCWDHYSYIRTLILCSMFSGTKQISCHYFTSSLKRQWNSLESQEKTHQHDCFQLSKELWGLGKLLPNGNILRHVSQFVCNTSSGNLYNAVHCCTFKMIIIRIYCTYLGLNDHLTCLCIFETVLFPESLAWQKRDYFGTRQIFTFFMLQTEVRVLERWGVVAKNASFGWDQL